MRSTSSTAHSLQALWGCVAGVPLPTALCPQLQCSRAHTVQCSAQHQAVRHHTESTNGAARHARCSGPMRPCVTAHRRRQSNAGQVRVCTGPAMQQHTSTQRAHNTHSPTRLPVPVGRHPGLCLLVTAPSAHHITPHPGGGGVAGIGKKMQKNAENAAENAIENAALLEWCMPPKTPMFIKTHVDLLTPSLHQCEDDGPGSTCKVW